MSQNQHYIPKFYIKNFKNENIIHFTEKGGFSIKNEKRIFSIKNYYGEDNCFLEKEFSNQERKAAPIIKKILYSNKEVKINREEKNELSKFLSFLPRRNPSMERNYESKDMFLFKLERELKSLDENSWLPGIKNIQNNILYYTMKIWETEWELPLFPQSIGTNENHWGGKVSYSGKKVLDCEEDFRPDFLFFPISNNKIIIFYNQKFSFAGIEKRMGIPKEPVDWNKQTKLIHEFIHENYCYRSTLASFRWFDFAKAKCEVKFKNQDFVKGNHIYDYSKASPLDEYTYKFQKMDYEMYKYIILENLITSFRSNIKDDFIISNINKFKEVLNEIYKDLRENFNKSSIDEYSVNNKVFSKDWYRMQIYKISTPDIIEGLEGLMRVYDKHFD